MSRQFFNVNTVIEKELLETASDNFCKFYRNYGTCLENSVFLSRPQKRRQKVKFTLEQATRAQRGSRGLALLFL